MKVNGLVFLGLSSLCLISGYAWSSRLDKFTDVILVHGAAAEDSIEETNFQETFDKKPASSKSESAANQMPNEELEVLMRGEGNGVQWNKSFNNLEEENGVDENFQIS